jgi:hypothetical protein
VSFRLAEAADDGNVRWLENNVTRRLARTYSAQNVTVYDPQGLRLAVDGETLPELTADPAFGQSQFGVVVSKYAYMSGGLWLIATAPILSHDFDQEVHGVLVLAQRVDQSFAGIVAGLVNTEVTFFVKDEVLASTNARLADQLDEPAAYAVLKETHELVQTGKYSSRGSYLGVDGTDRPSALDAVRSRARHRARLPGGDRARRQDAAPAALAARRRQRDRLRRPRPARHGERRRRDRRPRQGVQRHGRTGLDRAADPASRRRA